MSKIARNGIVAFNQLTEIESYNVKVTDWLKTNPLTPISQESIKIFNDTAFREKYSATKYNTEVEKYNNQYKEYTLYKRVIDAPKKTLELVHYNYINYPLIDAQAFKMTMQNYRAEVKRYNDKVLEQNATINQQNSCVKSKLTEKELDKHQQFSKNNAKLSAQAYNILAVEYNNQHGNIIKLKRIPKIRSQYELTFQSILGFYGSQIKQRNDFKQSLGKSTAIKKNELPALKIDYRKLATHKIDGVQRLDICKKTAQNHIKRLRDAGIITNYQFINSTMAVKCQISSKIVVVFDAIPPKCLTTENQSIKVERSNVLHNDSDTTRSLLLKEDKIKDLVNQVENKQPLTEAITQFYKNTQLIRKPQETKKTKKEISAKFFKGSEQLKELLVPPHILAQQLANGDYNNYTALRKDRLIKEVLYGYLTKKEFRTLIIYDIFKIHAKVYKNSHVFAGNWTKTIQRALKTWFIDKGYNQPYHKQTIFDLLDQYRWKLNFARKFYLKSDVNPLFPYQYFNPARTLTKELGFYGLHKIYKSKLKQVAKQKEVEKQERYENNQRKHRLTTQNKIEKRIKAYLKSTINLDTLYNYVHNNFNKNWLVELPNMIGKAQVKQLKTAI